MTPTETNLYNAVKDNLGVHLTLNPNVSPEVGCAEAVSKLMQIAGISVPKNGIPGTASLLAWMLANPDFEEIYEPEQGAVLVAATGSGNNSFPGHTGVFGAFGVMYVNDWGICSNDSNTGTLREQWNWTDWKKYYDDVGGMKTRIFRCV